MLAQRALFAERAGDRLLADQLLADAVEAERRMGLPGLIEVLTTSGTVFADRGEHARAAEALSEALATAAAHGSLDRLARVLEAISGLVAASQPDGCVRLAAAADELRDSLRALPRPSERRRLGTHLQAAKRRLGEAPYAATWSAARTEPLDTILDEGRELLRNLGVVEVEVPAPTSADSLSDREREVVLLVMRGLSNRAIADELVVARKTAEAHIGHILTKLGLTNRVQIATWAYEHGLAPAATDAPADQVT